MFRMKILIIRNDNCGCPPVPRDHHWKLRSEDRIELHCSGANSNANSRQALLEIDTDRRTRAHDGCLLSETYDLVQNLLIACPGTIFSTPRFTRNLEHHLHRLWGRIRRALFFLPRTVLQSPVLIQISQEQQVTDGKNNFVQLQAKLRVSTVYTKTCRA